MSNGCTSMCNGVCPNRRKTSALLEGRWCCVIIENIFEKGLDGDNLPKVYTEDGGKEKAIDHPLYLLLHDEPNPEMSCRRYISVDPRQLM